MIAHMPTPIAENRDVDVLLVSDLRFPGGTSHSIATEIRAQQRVGYTTGLVHLNGPLVRRVRPVNPVISRLVRSAAARLFVGREEIRTRLVVFRHPGVLQAAADRLPTIVAEHVIVLANAGPRTLDGRSVYDVAVVDGIVREKLGRAPIWAPIGPLVREEILADVPPDRLAADDWVNIIDVDEWQRERATWASDRPVIGRHSRSSPQKWPADAATLRAVYPTDGSWEVRVLGGAAPVADVLGRVPRSWQVTPFGAMSPQDFLAGLDFFVYYHDPRWVEAFGRTILEALASGVPAVLPPHFRALFGDAAIYAEPAQVRGLVERLRADRTAYDAHVERAREEVRRRFSFATHADRLAAIIGPPSRVELEAPSGDQNAAAGHDAAEQPDAARAPSEPAVSSVAPGPTLLTPGVAGPRVLLMSSNGTGMGHLTRLLSYARRLRDQADVRVLSMSQAAPVARRLGLPWEYLPSAKTLGMPPGQWRPMFASRLVEVQQRYRPDVVVFDGTWPYNGIEEARDRVPAPVWVWSRRGMWRAGMNRDQLDKAEWFDTVLEPGDLAAAVDAGATVTAPAHRVGPVTLLDPVDGTSREEARHVLGLPEEGLLALVSLGAGNINDTSGDIGAAAVALGSLGVGVCVTVPEIARSGAKAGSDVHLVRHYPLSEHYAAFDLVISACGYNSFHELLRFGVPTLFVPNRDTMLDDQEGRARYAADQGWAHQAESLVTTDGAALMADLLERGRGMAAVAQRADPGNGATDAARYLVDLAEARA